MEQITVHTRRRKTWRRKPTLVALSCGEDILARYRELSFREREHLTQAGFTKNQLVSLKNTMGIDYDTLAELLAVTTRCLYLKKGNDLFSPNTSDRIASILELYCDGLDIFASVAEFNTWLTTPQVPLHNRRPLDVAKTHPGLLKIRERMFRERIARL
ncbi:antitoxin Xre/MbcA/ParS toxin-binding domain-containing protein [Chitinophaga sp.]|uniref:antitoxin Xre/MbcA/ParS toxin-binding domain-containing protein n=1 Tax=Chitinophaga sp. TaxID=1869181 RepID=UPI002624278E|nr:antitoxin Xre/MbcA/ParS toxin-binding domain-containing protein [uncultured Chitinophaga sp.]